MKKPYVEGKVSIHFFLFVKSLMQVDAQSIECIAAMSAVSLWIYGVVHPEWVSPSFGLQWMNSSPG